MELFSEVDNRVLETFLFVSKLLIAGLVFQFILFVDPSTYHVQAAFTALMGTLLSLAGLELTYSGIRIFTSEATYVVVQDCLGWKSMAVFIALIWASTKRTLEHLNFILLGLGLLVVANIVRVFSTVYLAEIGVVSFEIIHDTLWRWSLTVLILGMWFYWLRNWKDEERFNKRIREQVEKYR